MGLKIDQGKHQAGSSLDWKPTSLLLGRGKTPVKALSGAGAPSLEILTSWLFLFLPRVKGKQNAESESNDCLQGSCKAS